MTAEIDPESPRQDQEEPQSETGAAEAEEDGSPLALLSTSPLSVAAFSPYAQDTHRQGPGFLFLSLFLVVLAFFIVLASISQPRSDWSRSVLESLSRTFAPHAAGGGAGLPARERAAENAEILVAQRLEALLAAELEIAEVRRSQNGRRLEVTVAADDLYFEGEARLRPSAMSLVVRVADAVRRSMAEFKPTTRFLVRDGSGAHASLPTNPYNLAVARADAMARALAAEGPVGDRLVVGIEAGDPGLATFAFHIARGAEPADPGDEL